MPNFQTLLNAQIARVSRRELRSEIDALRETHGKMREDISILKKSLNSLSQRVTDGEKAANVGPRDRHEGTVISPSKFSPSVLAAQRKRLGVSAADMGLLLGVSALSVYHWESGKRKPRERYLQSIAALKRLGKKQAAEVIEQQFGREGRKGLDINEG